jgi:hypothetical protein
MDKREYNKQYRENNLERLKLNFKQYRENNLERIKMKQKERYQTLSRSKIKKYLIEKALRENQQKIDEYKKKQELILTDSYI